MMKEKVIQSHLFSGSKISNISTSQFNISKFKSINNDSLPLYKSNYVIDCNKDKDACFKNLLQINLLNIQCLTQVKMLEIEEYIYIDLIN